MKTKNSKIITAALALVAFAFSLHAADPTRVVAIDSGEFSDSATWAGGIVPGKNNGADNTNWFRIDGFAVTLSDGGAFKVGPLTASTTGDNNPRVYGASSVLSITNGTLSIDASFLMSVHSGAKLTVGGGTKPGEDAANTANLLSFGSSTPHLRVYDNSTLEVHKGGNITTNGYLQLSTNGARGTTSTFTMTGGTAQFAQIHVASSTGTAAAGTGGAATLNLSGGTLRSTGMVIVGNTIEAARLNISGTGVFNANSGIRVGNGPAAAAGTTYGTNAVINISDNGALNLTHANNGHIELGAIDNARGELTMTNDARINLSNNLILGKMSNATGIATLSKNAQITITQTAKRINIATVNGTTGTLTLDGDAKISGNTSSILNVGATEVAGLVSKAKGTLNVLGNSRLEVGEIRLGLWSGTFNSESEATARFAGTSETKLLGGAGTGGRLSLRSGDGDVSVTLADQARITNVGSLRVYQRSKLYFEINDEDFTAKIELKTGGLLELQNSARIYADLSNFVQKDDTQTDFSFTLITGIREDDKDLFEGSAYFEILDFGANANLYTTPEFEWELNGSVYDLKVSFAAVPEPSAYAAILGALALIALALRRRK